MKKGRCACCRKGKGLKAELLQSVIEINGVNFIGALVDLEPASMKDLSFGLQKN